MNHDQKLKSIEHLSGTKRLEAIAKLDLGIKSESARKVLDRRQKRKELMQQGFSFEQACKVVNNDHLRLDLSEIKSGLQYKFDNGKDQFFGIIKGISKEFPNDLVDVSAWTTREDHQLDIALNQDDFKQGFVLKWTMPH